MTAVLEALQNMATESVDCAIVWPAVVEGRGGIELQRAFVELRRVLVQAGTVWLRLADVEHGDCWAGAPWRVVLALQAAGWIVRNAVVLQQPVPPTPERRRLETAHELMFLLAKSRTYYFDRDSFRDDSKGPGDVWTSASVSRCIEAACPPGGTVLDPFCLTSATADAARRLGRRFVGITTNETRWAA